MTATTPVSEPQLFANRQNAQNSTGPRTDAGKSRTRLNGLRHGLTGQTIVMPYEDLQAYQLFCTETTASLNPATDPERALAQTIADDTWRLNRSRAIEENIFSLGLATVGPEAEIDAALNQAITFLDHAREIQLLTLYAGRIARTIDKNKRELQVLQTERRAFRERELEEAILLTQLEQSKGGIYDPSQDAGGSHIYTGIRDHIASPLRSVHSVNAGPAQLLSRGMVGDPETYSVNGFGFSTAELTRIIHRRRRLAEARNLLSAPPSTLGKAA